jgi:DNA modification methylase
MPINQRYRSGEIGQPCYNPPMTPPTALADSRPRDENRLRVEDTAAHDWYRFVLSYPPHLVRDYLKRFQIQPGMRVLDPFCGTGTTLSDSRFGREHTSGPDRHPAV